MGQQPAGRAARGVYIKRHAVALAFRLARLSIPTGLCVPIYPKATRQHQAAPAFATKRDLAVVRGAA